MERLQHLLERNYHFPAGRLPRYALESLPVLRALYDVGFSQINVPLATRAGDLFARGEDGVTVAFNYIDVAPTFEYDMRTLGRLVARLHQQTAHIAVPVTRELFAPSYAVEWHESVRRVRTQPAQEHIQVNLQQILDTYAAELECDWDTFEHTATQCQVAGIRYVITHGDAPGNVLQDTDGSMYLVDWDEILLAPAERDTWFLLDNPAFMAGATTPSPPTTPQTTSPTASTCSIVTLRTGWVLSKRSSRTVATSTAPRTCASSTRTASAG